jgi:hypothetical protein
MRKTLVCLFTVTVNLLLPHQGFSQGNPVDEIRERLLERFSVQQVDALKTILPNYASQRVWGLAIGDFSNDPNPDLAISVYDLSERKNQVRVMLLQSDGANQFTKLFEKIFSYIESPIEVGLTTENSVVTIIQKKGDQEWEQQGYTVQFGDLIMVDHFTTGKEDVTGGKPRAIGHEIYRNYESLMTREKYFTQAGEQLFAIQYYSIPSYHRLRDVYPGYGRDLYDTTNQFILTGTGLRKDARDLSIERLISAYDDDYIYISATVNDDRIVGGEASDDGNDRITLWFDTKLEGDRRVKSRQGGFPQFRNSIDTTLYRISFILPREPGKVSRVTYSAGGAINEVQKSSINDMKAVLEIDTSDGSRVERGIVTGYTLKARVPFTFLGFETNPAAQYEKISETRKFLEPGEQPPMEMAELGFTLIVEDIDEPGRAQELTQQATSQFRASDPSSFGALLLQPSKSYYGDVKSTYHDDLIEGLKAAGF